MDINEIAHNVVQAATKKNPHAVALGRKGASKGGRARAEKLTPEQRSEIARKAGKASAKARWGKT